MIPNFQPLRGDGRAAMNNSIAAFWQSRMTIAGKLAPLPKIIDIPAFARQLACMGDGCGRTAPSVLPAAEVAESSDHEKVVFAVLRHPPGAIL